MKQFDLKEYLANPNKKVITRDGRNVTILCTNFRGIFPIIGEIESVGKSFSYNEDGKTSYVGSSIHDLFFAPEKHEGWINIFKSSNDIAFLGQSRIFESKEDAQKDGKDCESYVATVRVEWED